MKKSFAARLIEARGKRSRAEMANIFGVSVSSYGNWERGDKEPSLATIGEICHVLGVTPNWLLGIGDAAGPIAADSPPAAATAAPDPPPPWLAIIASQQDTIAQLVRRLPVSLGPTRAPAPAGGQAATKIA